MPAALIPLFLYEKKRDSFDLFLPLFPNNLVANAESASFFLNTAKYYPGRLFFLPQRKE